MTRRARVRRTLLVCCHFLRNLAFYRAGRHRGQLVLTGQFWANANSNCLDHCVLEWCKLFAEPRGKHYFAGIVDDAVAFRAQLLAAIRMNDADFETYVKKMRTYRDKFVAHLDRDETMFIPWLRPARRCISFLYDHIAENENGYFPEGLHSARDFYLLNTNIGRGEVAAAQAT